MERWAKTPLRTSSQEVDKNALNALATRLLGAAPNLD
jgi:hypothetical protein